MSILAHVELIHALPLFLLVLAFAVGWHKACYHLRTVEAGRLYRSGQLSRIGLWWVRRRYGIRTIVNLMTEYECGRGLTHEREKQFCKEKGIELVHLPLVQGTVPNPAQIQRFVQVSLAEEFLPVLVHCKQGVVRTNTMVAVYLKERTGLPNDQILRELPLFGHMANSPRYERMREFVLNYKPIAGTGQSVQDLASHQENRERTSGRQVAKG